MSRVQPAMALWSLDPGTTDELRAYLYMAGSAVDVCLATPSGRRGSWVWVRGIRPGASADDSAASVASAAMSFLGHAVEAVAYHDARGPESLAAEYGSGQAAEMRALARRAKSWPGWSVAEGWLGRESPPWVACDVETGDPQEDGC